MQACERILTMETAVMTETTLAPGATVEPLVHKDRARAAMKQASLDALFGCDDDNLCYLSGHAPDSVLCHFYDDWAVAILPRHDAPACLVTSEYDIAYVATHRTWMPEVRFYGAEWSSASGLMKKIHAGEGLDTDLRKNIYGAVDKIGYPELKRFHQQNIAGKPYTLCVLASEKKLSPEKMAKYGNVTKLSLEQIFGY